MAGLYMARLVAPVDAAVVVAVAPALVLTLRPSVMSVATVGAVVVPVGAVVVATVTPTVMATVARPLGHRLGAEAQSDRGGNKHGSEVAGQWRS